MSKIDVKDCCYYNSDNEPYCCELYDNECEAQNCYYKQFQQLKQENEELKQKLQKIKEVINCDDYNKEHCIYCAEAYHCYTKQVLEIIESEK